MFFFIILMLEETHVNLRVDCVGTSLPPVCTVPVEHPFVCLCVDGGLLFLPHHDCFFQVHEKRLVGWILLFFIILMLEETHVDIRVDFVGASLPPVCTVPVENPVVFLLEAGGLLYLPHHDFFFQVHEKRLVGSYH